MIFFSGESCLIEFIGTANAKCDKSSNVTYGLFKNSEINPIITSTLTFHNANDYDNFASVILIWLTKNDTLYIRGKSNTSNTEIDNKSLSVIFTQVNIR